jgi:hypothetical protein
LIKASAWLHAEVAYLPPACQSGAGVASEPVTLLSMKLTRAAIGAFVFRHHILEHGEKGGARKIGMPAN